MLSETRNDVFKLRTNGIQMEKGRFAEREIETPERERNSVIARERAVN